MYLKKWKQFNESVNNIWEDASNNTTLKVYYGGLHGKDFLYTCKTCDDIVNNTETHHRQTLGNVNQYITICDECGNPFIIDEPDDYEWFIENKEKVLKRHKSKLKPMQHIKITKEPLENDTDKVIEVTERVGDYYVYVDYTNTDYKMDSPPQWNTGTVLRPQWNLHLEPDGVVYSPYPYPNDNDGNEFPQDIINIFNKYVK